MTTAEIWAELEAEGNQAGEYRRRIHPDSVADLYLVVHKPSNTRGLLVDVDLRANDIGDLPTGRGIELRWVPSPRGQGIELVLSQQAFADLFDALVSDVAGAASQGVDDADVANRVAARVRRWQTFLRETSNGLSAERQRGLYGELYFLREILLPVLGGVGAAAAWVGPTAAPQDFFLGELAVEVKTTIANQHQVLRIASERQLDKTALEELVVFHLSVDGREGVGQSLPELIAGLRGELEGGVARFEELLFTGGYVDAHASLYRDGYTIREANLFRVAEGFPCLTEADCPAGTGDVSYSIAVSALSGFLIDAEVMKLLLLKATG